MENILHTRTSDGNFFRLAKNVKKTNRKIKNKTDRKLNRAEDGSADWSSGPAGGADGSQLRKH